MRPIIPTPEPKRPRPDPKAWEVYTWPQNGVGLVTRLSAMTLGSALLWAERALSNGQAVRVQPAL